MINKPLLLLVVLVIGGLLWYKFFMTNDYEEVYYDSGALKAVYPIKNDKVDGEVVEYYEDGRIKARVGFVDGKQHGKAQFFHLNGKLKKETFFVNGIQEDTLKFYYLNGRLQELSILKNGVKDGAFEDYYENGKLKSKGFVKNNRKDDVFKSYSSSGALEREDYFIDGTLISTLTYERNDPLKYKNEAFGYMFMAPKGLFKLDEKPDYVVFTEKQNGDGFVSSISVLMRKLDRGVSFDDFVDQELKSIHAITSDLELLNKNLSTNNGALVEYLATYKNYKVRVSTSFIEMGDNIAMITYMSDKESFHIHVSAYKNLLKDFQVF